jgi:hypothetical protein
LTSRIFDLHKHELSQLSEWVLEKNKPIYFYSYTGFEANFLVASTAELKEEEIKILIDAYLVTDPTDYIVSDDTPVWEDGDDVDIDWLFL